MTVSKRENFAAVWEALSTYEKAAIRKLALGFDWEIPETVRRRLRGLAKPHRPARGDNVHRNAGMRQHRSTMNAAGIIHRTWPFVVR